MTENTALNEKRISELDGIRGVAILLVIIWHYFNNQYVIHKSGFIDLVMKLTSNCWIGVDLFFILSGFLIGNILLRQKGSDNYFKTFYKRRIFRIFPIYYFIILMYVILMMSIANLSEIIPYLFSGHIPIWSYIAYCQNYIMISKLTLGPGWLNVTWSLAIEEQFYLVLPLLIFFFNRKALTILFILLIIAAAIFRYYSPNLLYTHFAFQCRMDTLFSGVLIAMYSENRNVIDFLKSKKTFLYILFLLLLSGFFVMSIITGTCYYFLSYTGVILLLSLSIIITLLFKENIASGILRNKLLRKIGTVSYGIYLYHTIVIYLIYWILEKRGVDINNNFIITLVATGAFIITFAISLFSYYFFESKLIKISHRFKY